ncbi:MAG: hypothetical protein KGI58_03905 [Patescibacteria group bacterium]|nr:hypothetical protein [Patescibacteria group bacterium]
MVNTFDDPSPWYPITNQVDLKHLGKLLEELGELTSAVSRCLIQGINEREPETNKLNRDWIEDEIADVIANIQLVEKRFKFIRQQERIEKKTKHLSKWHEMA